MPGSRDAVGQEHGGEEQYGFRVSGVLTCEHWSSPAGMVDDHTKQAAGGKGTLVICPSKNERRGPRVVRGLQKFGDERWRE